MEKSKETLNLNEPVAEALTAGEFLRRVKSRLDLWKGLAPMKMTFEPAMPVPDHVVEAK